MPVEGVGGACRKGGRMAARGGEERSCAGWRFVGTFAMESCSHPGCGQLIGVSEAAGAGLLRCTRCRRRIYCSKECQGFAVWDWG